MSDAPLERRLRGGRILLTSFIGIAALFLLGREGADLYVEALWQSSAGYEGLFWRRTLWQWGVQIAIGVIVGVAFALNLRIVADGVGTLSIRRKFGDLEITEQLPDSYLRLGIGAGALLMALWFGASVPPETGTRLLLLLEAPEWGLADPVLGRDVGFYLFSLPLLGGLLVMGMVLSALLLLIAGGIYTLTGGLTWNGWQLRMKEQSRRHLGILGAVFLLFLALRFWIGRYLLLLDGNSEVQGIFGFVDAQARLPGLAIVATLTLVASGVAAWSSRKAGRGRTVTIALGTVVVGSLLLGQLVPSALQRFQVEPNELVRESPYIEHALDWTRLGFGLDELEERQFAYTDPDEASVTFEEALDQLDGLPVWSRSALLTTFRELEARFRYYDFGTVAIDRYPGPDGEALPVAISVREVDPAGIEDPNWQNRHIRERYIRGMGIVATSATGATPEGRPDFHVAAIPPEFAGGDAPPGLNLDRAEVFFGANPQLYAIINPGGDAFTAPDGSPGEAGVDFPDGIALSSLARTAALAWRFRDANLFFSSEVTEESRFVFRRQVAERVQAIAPFLDYLERPYPVVYEGRIVWVLDAFTSARSFPLSTPHGIGQRRRYSYIRNSVKVTVDGLTGETRFYAVDAEDPLLRAFEAALPGWLRPLDEMPAGLQRHLRYPSSLLQLQSAVLLQYHQETPALFHGQQDVWSLAQELAQGTSPVAYRPEYGIYRLPGDAEPSFMISNVFVPAGRQNLTAVLAARSDPESYGSLVLLDVPVEDQVPGPRQVEALVEQDPVISQQFSLWRQGGSEVWTGHLHVIPVGGTLLYMEPIFLAAAADAIPELRRFVVSDGRRVVMTETLESALAQLLEGRTGVEEATGPRALPEAAAAPGLDWPDQALDLLRDAEEALRAGRWAEFGERWDRLRALLEQGAGDEAVSGNSDGSGDGAPQGGG